MITCSRRLTFCAGHRVMGHESKCANPHGHNYIVIVEAIGDNDDLDGIGRVIDFSVLKMRIGSWIERHWDHGFIHHAGDSAMICALNAFGECKRYALPYNPTAENLARWLLDVVCPNELDGTGVRVRKVTVWETENCKADVE